MTTAQSTRPSQSTQERALMPDEKGCAAQAVTRTSAGSLESTASYAPSILRLRLETGACAPAWVYDEASEDAFIRLLMFASISQPVGMLQPAFTVDGWTTSAMLPTWVV